MASEEVLEVLRGATETNDAFPAPKLLKIFIVSDRYEFTEERRVLLENVGPELHSQFDMSGVEVELVDMHYGAGDEDPFLDPLLFDDHLEDIRDAHRISCHCFMLVLVGDMARPVPAPVCIDATLLESLINNMPSHDAETVKRCYRLRPGGQYHLLFGVGSESDQQSLSKILTSAIARLPKVPDAAKTLLKPALVSQMDFARGLSERASDGILAVTRKWSNERPVQTVAISSPRELEQVAQSVETLQHGNHAVVMAPAVAVKPPTADEDDSVMDQRDIYLESFQNTARGLLYGAICRALNARSEPSSRNKSVTDLCREALAHLAMIQRLAASGVQADSEALTKVRERICRAAAGDAVSRHGPVLVVGPPGSGKTTLLSAVYHDVQEWLGRPVYRVVRFAGATPRSSYSLELVRLLCQHLAVLLKQSILPKDASLEMPYIHAWLERLLRRFEDANADETLVLLIDDLPRLTPLDQEQGPPALAWLPASLPRNVHVIATSSVVVAEGLRLTALQRDALRNPDCMVALPSPAIPLEVDIEKKLQRLEVRWSRCAIGRFCGYLSCAQYGLTELELLELMMPTSQSAAEPLRLQEGNYNFSTFCRVRRDMGALLWPCVLSGQLVIRWRHPLTATLCRARYLSERDAVLSTHARLATLLFGDVLASVDDDPLTTPADNAVAMGTLAVAMGTLSTADGPERRSSANSRIGQEEVAERDMNDDRDLIREEEEDEEALEAAEAAAAAAASAATIRQRSGSAKSDETDQDAEPCDVSFSQRHVEEAWLQLLLAENYKHLLKLTVCNFDFLLAAVQNVSVAYLRCLLEHTRGQLLARALELVYYTLRKSGDVLVRDPLQLAAQLVCWLRPAQLSANSRDETPLPDLVTRLLSAAMAWCDGYTGPLLVPLTGWLQAPLPLQIRSVICSGGIRLVEPTPCGQHVVVVPTNGAPQLWHIMSNALVATFKGHTGPVTCLFTTETHLVTGSSDLSVITWNLKTYQHEVRIQEHIAPVLSLTPALDFSVVVSGGEDSSIIVASMRSGRVKAKIDHHRGPVTALCIDSGGDVLVSGSSDHTVCLWALENCELLNTIQLQTGVILLGLSPDSVFLLAVCDNNQICLHSMATGTEIHTLRGHRAKVCSLCLAADNWRAVLGAADGKVYVFDLHSGRLERTLATHTDEVVGVRVTERDDFLLTAGGNIVTLWSFRRDEASAAAGVAGVPGVAEAGGILGPAGGAARRARKMSRQSQVHTAPIICLEISKDGTLAVTGSVDSLVNLWVLNPPELSATLDGHIASVTAVAFAPSGLFCVSGSEDKTLRVWGLTLGQCVTAFKGHQSAVTAVCVMADSRRVLSGDRQGTLAVWLADDATLLQTASGPGLGIAVTPDMKYAVSGIGDTSVRILSVTRKEEVFVVSHSDEVTCMSLTADSIHLITGSRDSSLKVWQLAGGKLAQVLVGHTDEVTCVGVSVTNKSLVVSGSKDFNLICWDITTGTDVHTLSGHLGVVTCVRVSGDGVLAVSGSEDRTIMVWDVAKGSPLTALVLHQPILAMAISPDASRLGVQLLDSRSLLIVCLHNSPASYVTLPAYVAPKEMEDLRPAAKRPLRRLLKKEVSLDTYTWQKKYGHLTSSIMMAAVDERLKRRFSVSASMEEISKCKGAQGPAAGIGPEQAALAQSQHFDQLEALWNQRSPPQRRKNQLKKQVSLSSCRDVSDNEDMLLEEGVGFSGD